MRRIGFLLLPNFQAMYFAALSVFEAANIAAGQTLYKVELVSEHGGGVPNSLGMLTDTAALDEPNFDTLLVGAGPDAPIVSDALVSFVQRAQIHCRRLGSICTGAFVLAQAGVLDGKKVTTHWIAAPRLQELYPNVKLDSDRIFIVDGSVWTSAGMSACIDLALGMVEKDHGAALAENVAHLLVVYHRRAGGQSQHSELLKLNAKSDRIQNALDYASRNLKSPLLVEELANAAHLSLRQFNRAFRAETGESPARAVEKLRLEAARLMLEQTSHSIGEIAVETGFGDPERMRRAFVRTYAHSPQVFRRNAKEKDSA